jgi:hypothetical protein
VFSGPAPQEGEDIANDVSPLVMAGLAPAIHVFCP